MRNGEGGAMCVCVWVCVRVCQITSDKCIFTKCLLWLKSISSEMQNTSAKTRMIIFITCRDIKRQSIVETYSYFMNSNSTKRTFQRNFHIKKIEPKLSRGFFFPFLQTSENRNLFLPSSLNWMQFIASPKLIFHWLAGSMGHGRQCVSARLPWPRVLICGNWPGDMKPNQWRQRDRGENQSLIAKE